ncbi:MAG: hypothetical protein U0451_04105 [Candidatus Saccharimonadales bacterium]
MQENLSQTGQVSPETQNPQSSYKVPDFQKGATDIQISNDTVLKSNQSTDLVLPDGTSTIAPSTTAMVEPATVNNETNNLAFFPIAIIAFAVIVFGLLLKTVFTGQTENEELPTHENQDDLAIEVNTTKIESKRVTLKSGAKKKAKSSKKNKTGKKR